jgi:hypothetical protein
MACSSDADRAQIDAAFAAGESATARALAARIEAERLSRAALLRPRLHLVPAPRDGADR